MKAEVRKGPFDETAADLFVLAVPQARGPLAGGWGLLDWRLEGRLSALQKQGDCTGKAGERVLVLNVPKAGAPAAWIEGMGPAETAAAGVSGALLGCLRAAARAGARRVALAADPWVGPGRAFESLEALRKFLESSDSNGLPDRVMLSFFDEILI